MNMTAGMDNALKMLKMFQDSKDYQASFECDAYAPYIRVHLHPVLSGGFVERAIKTFDFREDGSYTSQVHL